MRRQKEKTMTKKYANIKEVSEYTSLPTKTLYDWASTGKMPSIKIGRRVLFDLYDIDNLMTSLKRNYNLNEKTTNKIIEGICD
jgi:excisionase family DNA binding protein